MSPYLGEFVGTMILIILGAGVCAGVNLKKSFANNGGWVVIIIGWGLGVTMGVFAVGSISGAHLNPAVTVGLAMTGDFAWNQVAGYIAAQMIGAIAGAAVVYLQYLPHWRITEDPGTKLGVFATGPAVPHTFSNLLSEMIGTFFLLFGLQFIGANQFSEGLNPFAVGLLIVAIGASLGGTTGYAINPARDLGPRIAHAILPIAGKGSSNWRYAWIPVIGPILGGALGALTHKAIFAGEFPMALLGTLIVSIFLLGLSYIKSEKLTNSANTADM